MNYLLEYAKVKLEILDIDSEIKRLSNIREVLERERIGIYKIIRNECNHELEFAFVQASENFYRCNTCWIYKSKKVDPYTKKEVGDFT